MKQELDDINAQLEKEKKKEKESEIEEEDKEDEELRRQEMKRDNK